MQSFLTDTLRRKFKELRCRVNYLVSDSRARFLDTFNENLSDKTKRFWLLFKLEIKDSSVPEKVSMKVIGSDAVSVHSKSCPRDVAEIFNDTFHPR